jgi:hypothetical protein
VDGIAYYVTDDFGERLYDSCKDVKFGTMNTRAIDFVGGGANNFKGDLLSCELMFEHLMQSFAIASLPVKLVYLPLCAFDL